MSAHTIPPPNYQNSLILIKRQGGSEVERITIKVVGTPVVPRPGDYYEMYDNVDNKVIKGTVTTVLHKNAVASGPAFNGSIEVYIEI